MPCLICTFSSISLFDVILLQPATVSRCGMVYLEPITLGWRPIVKSWINQFGDIMEREGAEVIDALFEWLLDPCMDFIRKHTKVSKIVEHKQMMCQKVE